MTCARRAGRLRSSGSLRQSRAVGHGSLRLVPGRQEHPGNLRPERTKTSQIALVSARDGSVRILKILRPGGPTAGALLPGRPLYRLRLPPAAWLGRVRHLHACRGRRPRNPVVQHPANDVIFDWTPDGKRILFGSDRSGTMGAWWIQIADGKPEGPPSWSSLTWGRTCGPWASRGMVLTTTASGRG